MAYSSRISYKVTCPGTNIDRHLRERALDICDPRLTTTMRREASLLFVIKTSEISN